MDGFPKNRNVIVAIALDNLPAALFAITETISKALKVMPIHPMPFRRAQDGIKQFTTCVHGKNDGREFHENDHCRNSWMSSIGWGLLA